MATPNARGSIENKQSIGAADMMPVSSKTAYPKDRYAGMSPLAIREMLLVKPKPKPTNTQKPGVTNSITTVVQKPSYGAIRGLDVDEIPADQMQVNGGLVYKTGSDKPFSGFISWKGFGGDGAKTYTKRYYQEGKVQSASTFGLDDEQIGESTDLRPKQKGLR